MKPLSPTLRLLDSEVVKKAKKISEQAKIEKAPRSLEDQLTNDLDISSMLNKLATMEPSEVAGMFNEILDEPKNKMLDKNDKFLKKLTQAKLLSKNKEGGKYDEDYFLEKRIKFLDILSKTHFFSDAGKETYEELREYTSLLGKLKDKGEFKKKHQELIENNPRIMEIIANLNTGNLENFKNKYESTVNDIRILINKPEKKLDEHAFHNVRKHIRYCVFAMETLMKKLDLPEHKETASKLRSISGKLAKIREVTGPGQRSWKVALEDTLSEINSLYGLKNTTRHELAENAEYGKN